MTDAFGVVALVALTPLIAVQIMGLQYQSVLNQEKKDGLPEAVMDTLDDIVDFEEEEEDVSEQ